MRLQFGNGPHPNHEGGDDVERGERGRGMSVATRSTRGKSIVSLSELEGVDEYTALQQFIVRYKDPRAAQIAALEAEAKAPRKAPWWKFWSSGGSSKSAAVDPSVIPEDWLNTHISQGLSTHDVDTRRKRTGWNEISSEKENMFKKFLGFFNGPILWGKLPLGARAVRKQLSSFAAE